MCDPISIIEDIALTAIGQPELIPIVNGVTSFGESLASGKGFGKSLLSGALSGGEALAGQALTGAIGIGEGNSFLNDALGTDSTLGLGLPDIGGGISDALGLGGGSSASGSASGTGGAQGSGFTTEAPTSPSNISPSAGAITGAGQVGAQASQALNTQIGQGSIAGASTATPTSLGTLSAPSGLDEIAQANLNSEIASGSGAGGGFNGVLERVTGSGGIAGETGVSSAVAGAAPAASGGLGSKLLSGALKYGAPLGELAYSAISGPGALPDSAKALQAGGAATKPLLDTETSSLAAYNSGQLTPSQTAQISQYVTGAQNQLIQQLSSQGVRNLRSDSRYLAGLQEIQKNALALQQQFLQQTLQAGLSAAGAASGNLAGVAGQEINNDNAFQKSLSDAIASLSGIAGGASASKGMNARAA